MSNHGGTVNCSKFLYTLGLAAIACLQNCSMQATEHGQNPSREIVITEYDRKRHESGIASIMSQAVEIDGKTCYYEYLVSSKVTIIDSYNNPANYIKKIFVALEKRSGGTEKVIGFASITQDLPSVVCFHRGLYINWLAVDKNYLQRGIGFQLFSAVKGYAQQNLIKTISIRARSENLPAQRSYARWTNDANPAKDGIGPIYTYHDRSPENMTNPDGTAPNLKALALSDANIPDDDLRLSGYQPTLNNDVNKDNRKNKPDDTARSKKWFFNLNGLSKLWIYRCKIAAYSFLTFGAVFIGCKMWSKRFGSSHA